MLKVKVTQADIDEARRRRADRAAYWSPCDCMVAVALARTTESKRDDVSCGITSFSVGSTVYQVPKSIRGYISAFDRRETVEPFEFTAPRILRISVDEVDIEKARANRAAPYGFNPLRDCLVATTVRRMYPDQLNWCGLHELHVNGITYKLPQEAVELIYNYCQGRPLEPLSFYAVEASQCSG